MIKTLENLSSKQRDRLFFIEFCLLFLGQLRRKDLVSQYRISEPAATKDLSLYNEINPNALEYDFRKKHYLYTGAQLLFEHNVGKSLFSLAGTQSVANAAEQPVLLPSFTGDSIKRAVPLETVSAITRSINLKHKIQAVYRSMNSGERARVLSPLALIHDGLRWHIRCLDEEQGKFKDYNLARFVSVVDQERSDATLDEDVAWNRWVELSLVSHPKSKFPETIELDYDMQDGRKLVSLRSCVVGYFLRHWHIDCSDRGIRDPREYQLYLSNKQELLDAGVDEWAFI